MKIWIDLTNSPHINFFQPFIEIWKSKGEEIIITSRKLANTIELIEQNGWRHKEIGGHVGKNLIKKIFYFPLRVLSLIKYLRTNKPDIAISHSSFYSPVAAFLLNIPSLYINDNEHAKGNYLAFLFATLVIFPEALKKLYSSRIYGLLSKIEFYPGIKEGIYLSQKDIFRKVKSISNGKNIFIRLEPSTAQYYRGNSSNLDSSIRDLSKKYFIYLLPRNRDQIQHFEKLNLKNVKILSKSLSLEEIYEKCDIFIGAGGSMTREFAVLGVLTFSTYQGELLAVDKYLISSDAMFHTSVISDKLIIDFQNKKVFANEFVFDKGKIAFNRINDLVYEYAKN